MYEKIAHECVRKKDERGEQVSPLNAALQHRGPSRVHARGFLSSQTAIGRWALAGDAAAPIRRVRAGGELWVRVERGCGPDFPAGILQIMIQLDGRKRQRPLEDQEFIEIAKFLPQAIINLINSLNRVPTLSKQPPKPHTARPPDPPRLTGLRSLLELHGALPIDAKLRERAQGDILGAWGVARWLGAGRDFRPDAGGPARGPQHVADRTVRADAPAD